MNGDLARRVGTVRERIRHGVARERKQAAEQRLVDAVVRAILEGGELSTEDVHVVQPAEQERLEPPSGTLSTAEAAQLLRAAVKARDLKASRWFTAYLDLMERYGSAALEKTAEEAAVSPDEARALMARAKEVVEAHDGVTELRWQRLGPPLVGPDPDGDGMESSSAR